MGALEREYHPFAEEEVSPPAVHPIDALHEMAELLELVHYWRTKYETLANEKKFRINRWRAAQKK